MKTTSDTDKKQSEPEVTLITFGCSSHSQCEHEWGGWREFEDGRGGEQLCKKCGMGAMAHSLRLDW